MSVIMRISVAKHVWRHWLEKEDVGVFGTTSCPRPPMSSFLKCCALLATEIRKCREASPPQTVSKAMTSCAFTGTQKSGEDWQESECPGKEICRKGEKSLPRGIF